jgi:NADH:ubiquinone oxidoreductase subunit 2 (subunit N)
MQAHDLISILPELLLLVTACAVLLIDTFLKKDKTALVAVSVTGLLASGVISLALVGQDRVAFSGMLALNSCVS